MVYHKPVLLSESIEGLNINPEGVYVDVTFGGGGHSRMILEQLIDGKLFAFDQDVDANDNLLEDKRLKLLNANFRHIKQFLKVEGVQEIDGLLADLGVSSHQLDVFERGFSTRSIGPLDMRMNSYSEIDAKYVINKYSEKELANMLFEYGELRESRKIARAIVQKRKESKINNTKQLIDCIKNIVPEKIKNQFLSRVFQAIRIEVNDEICALKEMLIAATELLKKGGRLSIISYHSLEDRLAKNIIKKGNLEGKLEKDFYGNPKLMYKSLNKRVIIPSDEEIKENSRARSAKLRVAEKI